MLRRRFLTITLIALALTCAGPVALAQKKPRTKAEREFAASVARFRQRVEAELAK